MTVFQLLIKIFHSFCSFKIAHFAQQMPFFVFENRIKEVHICIVSLNNEIELTEMTQFSNNIGRLKARAPRAFSLLFLFLLLGNMSFAQGWERYYGLGQLYQINDIVQASDEGFLFTGNAGPAPTVVYRLNAQGDVVWFKDDFSSSVRDAGNAILETENGNILVAGFCDGCGTFGAEDATVYRLDAFGNVIWG